MGRPVRGHGPDHYVNERGRELGTTPTAGLPYPEPTDPVALGADAIKSLATALDLRVPIKGLAWGLATLTGITAGNLVTMAVTFPAGRFTLAPNVQLTLSASNSHGCYPPAATGVTATGFTLNGGRSTGNANIPVYWMAFQ